MRKLIDTPNIEPATGDFPKGRVRDKAGATPGTTYTETLHGDIIQLFQKLIIDGGIVENDAPDNVSNGYQLLDALVDKIQKTAFFRASTNTINDGNITTSETDVVSFVPDAANDYTNISIDFCLKVTLPSLAGLGRIITYNIYSGGVIRETFTLSYKEDGAGNSVSFKIAGIAYVAGDEVKITAQMSGGTSIAVSPNLIVESSVNSVVI